ncbi:MAG: hypothetical protein U0V64_06670 [Cyclobacteriaceae bacterium]
MKKAILTLALFALITVSFSSCTKEDIKPRVDNGAISGTGKGGI